MVDAAPILSFSSMSRITLFWIVLAFLLCMLFRTEYSYTQILMSENVVISKKEHSVDAIVFVAMGRMASDPMVDYAIASVRNRGKWKGELYVVTDFPTCFDLAGQQFNVKVLRAPSVASVIEIKAMKPYLMNYMPNHVSSILYVDVDVVVSRNLAYFFDDFQELVVQPHIKSLRSAQTLLARTTNSTKILDLPFDFAAFLDAKAHYVGWCSGCEKWHTGVIWLRRGHGAKCLTAWRNILLSGKYTTDQQSLDEAEAQGHCPHAIHFPSRHLLFAKDYIAMLLTAGQTFIHITAAGRPEDNDFFYRQIVIPNLRKEDSHILLLAKNCSNTS